MEFELEDIKPGLQVQIVASMHFDRRVFLVANTGDKRPGLHRPHIPPGCVDCH